MRLPSLNKAAFNLTAFAANLTVAHAIYSYKPFSARFHVPIQRDTEQKAINLKAHIAFKALGVLIANAIPITFGAFILRPTCANSAHLYCLASIVHFCFLARQQHGTPKR